MSSSVISPSVPVSPELLSPDAAALAAPDADFLTLYTAETSEAVGLLAYALHRRCLAEWALAFASATGAPPDALAFAQFRIGEAMPSRINAYRLQAMQLLSVPQSPPAKAAREMQLPTKPDPKRFLNWGLDEALAHAKEPLPWRALTKRLILLLLAVIVSALVLRFLVAPQ